MNPIGPGPMIMGTGWREAGAFEIYVVLVSCKLNIENQLSPAACASRGRWRGWEGGKEVKDLTKEEYDHVCKGYESLKK